MQKNRIHDAFKVIKRIGLVNKRPVALSLEAFVLENKSAKENQDRESCDDTIAKKADAPVKDTFDETE